jgi:hypothetical protein
MFLANPEYRKEHGNVAPTLTWLNLESKKAVDQLYRAWTVSNAKLMSTPESKPWGLHEFTVANLDANLFRLHSISIPPDFRTHPMRRSESNGIAAAAR